MSDANTTCLPLINKRRKPFNFVDGISISGNRILVDEAGRVVTEKQLNLAVATTTTKSLVPGNTEISTDLNNRLKTGTDGKLYVEDNFNPDPLAYYILAKS